MKKIILLVCVLTLAILSACATVEKTTEKPEQAAEEEFYEKIPVIDAYYKGEKIWFIHTDVTSPEMAERLTAMVDYTTLYVPKHSEAVDTAKIAKLYVFTNGIDQSDAKPWGGGPFNYQIDIFDSIPGESEYTSIRNPNLVTWDEGATPRILKSEEELLEAEANGELIIKKTPVVVNVPVVRWPGGGARIS